MDGGGKGAVSCFVDTGGFLGVCGKKAIATDIRWVEVGSGEGSWPVVE